MSSRAQSARRKSQMGSILQHGTTVTVSPRHQTPGREHRRKSSMRDILGGSGVPVMGADEIESDEGGENTAPALAALASSVNSKTSMTATTVVESTECASAGGATGKKAVCFVDEPLVRTIAVADDELVVAAANTDTWKRKYLDSTEECKRLVGEVDKAEAARDAQTAELRRATNELNNERLVAKRACDAASALKDELAALREETRALDIANVELRETADAAVIKARKSEAEAEYERGAKVKAQAALANEQTKYQTTIDAAERSIAELTSALEAERKRRIDGEQLVAYERKALAVANAALAERETALKAAADELAKTGELGYHDRTAAEAETKEKNKALARLADEQRRRLAADEAANAAKADAAEAAAVAARTIAQLEAQLANQSSSAERAVTMSDAAKHSSALAAAKASTLADSLAAAESALKAEVAKTASLQSMLEESLATLEATQNAFEQLEAAKRKADGQLDEIRESEYALRQETTAANADAQAAVARAKAAEQAADQLAHKLEIVTKTEAAAQAQLAETRAAFGDTQTKLEATARAVESSRAAADKSTVGLEDKLVAAQKALTVESAAHAEQRARVAAANEEIHRLTLSLERLQSELSAEAAARQRAEAAALMETTKSGATAKALADEREARQAADAALSATEARLGAQLGAATKRAGHAEAVGDMDAKALERTRARVVDTESDLRSSRAALQQTEAELRASARAAERSRQDAQLTSQVLAVEQTKVAETQATLAEKMAAWATAEAALTQSVSQAEGIAKREHEQRLKAERQFDVALHQALVGTPKSAAQAAAFASAPLVSSPYRPAESAVPAATDLAASHPRRQNPRRAARS